MIVSCFSDEAPPTFNDLEGYRKSNLNYGKTFRKLMQTATRSADDPEYLKVEVIKRVMCVSEDRTALVHAAINLQTIRGHGPLSSLIEDKEFYSRLSELNKSARDQWMNEQLATVTGGHIDFRALLATVTGTRSIEVRALFASFVHLWFSAGSTPDIDNPHWRDKEISSLEAYEMAESQFRSELIPSTPDCSRCSHCTTLWFCAKFATVMILRDHPRSTFSSVFKDVEGALTKSGGLRLGSVVASAILSSTMWGGAHPIEASPGGSSFRRSDRLAELMGAYREQSELEMVALVSRALATVNVDWMWKPSYGVYVRLFELGLFSERGFYGSIRTLSETPRILGHLGSILLSIEVVIRDEAASSAGAQRGREHQNRCIQSVVESLGARSGWFRNAWDDIGPALEPYLKGIKQQVKTDPANPNNPSAIALLRRIGSSFPTFAPDDDLFPTFARDIGLGRPVHPIYLKFREFVDQIELLCQTRNNDVSEGTGNVVALRRPFLHMVSDAREFLETHNRDKENARLHTPSDMWGN
ncbi:hypothetical protein FRC05_002283 [Tulasnella sp. 425]|nr:hypothetical protein FRC05_002283 [Tulasnella sp. 425]